MEKSSFKNQLLINGVDAYMKGIKVGIIGATGYAGVELIRLLANHPLAKLTAISSVSYENKIISDIYPNLLGDIDKILVDEDTVIDSCDVVFLSLPHGLSEKIAKKCIEKNVKVIDLGADFRLAQEDDYNEWYGLDYQEKDLHTNSVYCIPELFRSKINKNTMIVANPGCYPTSIALGLAPLLAGNLVDTNCIVIDSKSGVTGAGRSLTETTHFTNCNENFSAYKVASHRHTPEIEESIQKLSGKDIKVVFVPHLLPINRGILSTIYVDAQINSLEDLNNLYQDFYKTENFVRILPNGKEANIKNVKMTNYCDISLHYDKRTKKTIIVSCIDNMVKGAAGQAIQNMNILFGIKENFGLKILAPAF